MALGLGEIHVGDLGDEQQRLQLEAARVLGHDMAATSDAKTTMASQGWSRATETRGIRLTRRSMVTFGAAAIHGVWEKLLHME